MSINNYIYLNTNSMYVLLWQNVDLPPHDTALITPLYVKYVYVSNIIILICILCKYLNVMS